jgi:two-component system, NarL family, sensor histidine kinase EvgS
LLQMMLQQFLHTNRDDIAALTTAIGSQDAGQIRRYAHRVKGAAALIGATELAGQAQHLEHDAANQDLAQLDQVWAQLQSELSRVEQFIEGYCREGQSAG